MRQRKPIVDPYIFSGLSLVSKRIVLSTSRAAFAVSADMRTLIRRPPFIEFELSITDTRYKTYDINKPLDRFSVASVKGSAMAQDTRCKTYNATDL